MISPIKTLIVEDVKSIQMALDAALPDDLFDKRFASDGVEGLEVYDWWKPHLILLDIMMPVMTGYSMLKDIREKKKDSYTAVVMQTTVAGKSDVLECVKLGIQGYIVKPFDEKEVAGKVVLYYERVDPKWAKTAKLELKKAEAVAHLLKPDDGDQPASLMKSFTLKESEYIEEIRFCLDKGLISSDERRLLDRLRVKLGLDPERARELEDIVNQDLYAPSSEELEYVEELKYCLENGEISEDERRMLDRLRTKLKLSEKRAAELEKEVTAQKSAD